MSTPTKTDSDQQHTTKKKEQTPMDKKHLHIRSEQKRRVRITDGFQQLKKVVPTVKSGYDSKATVLQKSAEYIESLESRISTLKDQINQIETTYAIDPVTGTSGHYGVGNMNNAVPDTARGHAFSKKS